MGEELGEVVVGGKRHGPGERLEQDAPERVDIRACVHPVAAGLLGSHVVDRADERPGASQPVAADDVSREPEVRQVHVLAAAARGHQDVRGLDVPMHQPSRVGGVERLRDLVDDRGSPAGLEAALLGEDLAQVDTVDEAHRDEQRAVGLAHGVDGDHVRMLDLRGDRSLALEARAELGILGVLGRDHLERDDPVREPLARAVDDAHATPAGDRLDLETP